MDFALVVYPRHTELDNAFRLDKALKNAHFDIFRMLFNHRLKAFKHFLDSLMKFRLTGIARFNASHKVF